MRAVSSKAGFTIIELLVAAAVTLVMVGLALKIVTDTGQIFDRTTGQLDAKTQAHRVLDTLSVDLQNAVMKVDRNVWLLATIQPNQTARGSSGFPEAEWDSTNPKPLSTAPTTLAAINTDIEKPEFSIFLQPPGGLPQILPIADCRFGQAGMWLRFFTVQDNNGLVPGDAMASTTGPVAVGYQIIRTTLLGSTGASAEYRYRLYRSVVRPSSDIAAKRDRSVSLIGFDLADSNPDDTGADPDYYNNPAIANNDPTGATADPVEPGALRRPDRAALLANNVIDFGVRFYAANGSLIFPRDNRDMGFAATSRDPSDLLESSRGFPNLGSGANRVWNNIAGATGRTFWDAGAAPAAVANNQIPRVAELFVRVITDSGARELESFELGRIQSSPGFNDDQMWWKIALENSQVYTRRVELLAAPRL